MSSALKEYDPNLDNKIIQKIYIQPRLSKNLKLFFSEISDMAKLSKRGKVYYTCVELAKKFNVTRQCIIIWIRKLVRFGLIEIGVDYNTDVSKNFIKIKKDFSL